MILTPSDFSLYFQPSPCALRIFLKAKGEPESEPSPYLETLRVLGLRHEEAHLKQFPEFLDLRNSKDAITETITAVRNRIPVIYQGRLQGSIDVEGQALTIVGSPDFLILSPGGYIIRDSKMARRITDDDHPEIALQLQLYGWLFTQTVGEAPSKLEIHSGSGDIIEIPNDNYIRSLDEIRRLLAIRTAATEPYSPVGWTKCGGCGFSKRCWSKAEAAQDVALISSVDQNLALALRAEGVTTVEGLIKEFNEVRLSEFKRPWGNRTQKVGKKALTILKNATALITGKEILLSKPNIPKQSHYVMFDLEGMPPQLKELDKIYLWGTQVYGKTKGEYMASLSEFGLDGDRKGWTKFLDQCRNIFNAFGDIPFVHWASYEKTFVSTYLKRYGDSEDEIGNRVFTNLLDLLPVARESLALPLPSFSLKVIEKYIGFQRSQEEYGGQWSMAKYIEATETEDKNSRDKLMDEILIYNKEDLESMWAIFQWLLSKE